MKPKKVKKKTGKGRIRVFSMLMAAVLVMTGINMPVFSVAASGESHSHDTWTAWNNTSAMPQTAGDYYLTEDVSLADTAWTVPAGTTNLCLNGHTITQHGTTNVINVPNGAIFNLYDENDEGKITGGNNSSSGGGVIVNRGAKFTMYGGQVTDNKTDGSAIGGSGGGVLVSGGEFVMNGGIISNNRATSMHGGGIAVNNSGEVVMTGGSITGNKATRDSGIGRSGGGVYVESGSSFTMSGGNISGNEAANSGGGVNIDGTFTMSGGTMTGNIANGTSSDQGGGAIGNYGTLIITGGKITGNTARHGGGVYHDQHYSDEMTFSGTPVIKDNKNTSDETDNVYLGQGKTITIGDGGLQEGAEIGVKTEAAPTESSAVNLTGINDKDYSAYFVSDDGYAIRNESNILKIGGVPPTDEEKVAAAKRAVEEALKNMEATNDVTEESILELIQSALEETGITNVNIGEEAGEVAVTPATTSSDGSIRINLSIAVGNASDTIVLNKKIDRLPATVTDTEKVSEAKETVENVLKNLVVTNGSTKEEIQEAIDGELSKAGLSDVTVTVGDITKTEATTDTEGSIKGSITIAKGEITDSVALDKKIDRLPATVTDTEKVSEAKEKVKNVLEKLVLTNGSTKEEIQKAINEELSKAGLTDVEAKIGEITKTEATVNEAGRITIKFTFTRGDVTESVEVLKTIPRLSQNTPINSDKQGNLTDEQKQQIQTIAKELGVSEETAAKIQKIAEELGIPVETLLLGDGAFTGQSSEDDIKGSMFSMLQLKASKIKTNSVKLTWKKIKGADGYQIYGTQCLRGNKSKLIKTIEKGSTTSFTQKKLKKGKAYRYFVRAYKIVDGKRITIAASKTIHIFTNGGKYGNAKSVKINKTKASIKKGKKYRIKASEVKLNKPLKRHRKLSYESSNTKVATVTKKGVIKAVSKGTCTVYVYAQNGVYKKIKVTVK